jgi:hypothetical protein
MWDKAAVIANYLLVLVGIVGTIVAICTLKKIERQTKAGEDAAKAAKDGAEAALKQADNIVASERAWVLVAPEYDLQFPYFIKLVATNHGRSPAEVIWYDARKPTLKVGEELPSISPHWKGDRQFAHHHWIPPGKSMDENVCDVNFEGEPFISNSATLQDLTNGTQVQWVYGIICYKDTISRSEHETRFCFSFYKLSPKGVLGGPEGYNQVT